MRFRVGLTTLATLVGMLIGGFAVAAPAEAKVRVGLAAQAFDTGVTAAVTLKSPGRAPIRVTLQRKASGNWAALASATAKRGKATLRWSAALAPGQALRLRVVATRGKRTLATSASALVKVSQLAGTAPRPTPTPRPTPKPGSLEGDMLTPANEPPPTFVAPTGRRIAMSGDETCAVNQANEVRCWPEYASFSSAVPAGVADLPRAVVVTAGFNHTCAATPGGEVYCWGFNGLQQLGDGSTTSSTSAQRVIGLAKVSSIVAGADLTCANVAGQPPLCWGFTAVRPAKVPTGTLERPKNIGLGADWTIESIDQSTICARTASKSTCFGSNGATTQRPIQANPEKLASTATSSCSKLGPLVRCVGSVVEGRDPSEDLSVPTDLPGTESVEQLATNGVAYCGWSPARAPLCWGSPREHGPAVWAAVAVNGFEGGDGIEEPAPTPTPVPSS